MKSSFNNHLRTSLENHTVKYNPAHWDDLESKLNAIDAAKSTSSAGKKILLLAAAVVVIAGVTYLFMHNNSEINKTENNPPLLQPPPSDHESFKTVVDLKTTNEIVNNRVETKEVEISSAKIISENVNNQSAEAASEMKSEVIEKKEYTSVSDKNTEDKIIPSVQSDASSISAPSAGFRCSKNMICLGGQVQFFSDNNSIPCTYQWDFGDGEFSSDPNPIHIYKDPGNYNVKLRVVSKKDNKSDEQVVKNILTVHPIPSIDISASVSAENYSVVNFEAKGEDVLTWNWDFGDKQSSYEQSPSHSFNKKGNYQVMVTVKNKFACSTSVTKNVYIEHDFNLLAPSGFSPNGDGLNDTWLPAALVNGDYIFNLTIFDKAGNVAYVASDKSRPWDGRNAKTGYFAKMGEMYLWKATVQEGNGKVSSYDGYIVIADGK